ncbi:MAG: GntR family transcriptional regulator [Betaproteobacteria bacterium]|nr:GntR family transcriptional regulator [Betaproteobacteria bacterium]
MINAAHAVLEPGQPTIDMLQKSSLTGAVQQEIRRLIQSGELGPGDKLSEAVLAERLAGALIDIETADRDEIRDLLDRVSDLEAELSEARSTINYLETELENAQ